MVDGRLAALDHLVAAAADEWLDDPRDAAVYGRLVSAVEARRAHIGSRRATDGTELQQVVSGAAVRRGGTPGETAAPDGDAVVTMVSGDGRPRLTKAANTRTRVLDSAAKVFSRKGYTETRLSDIAAEAAMHSGSLYYHFRTREELVDEVLRVGQERVDRFVRQRVASLPPEAANLARLRELITAHLEMVLEIGNYTSAMIRIIGQVPEDVHRRRLHDQRQYGGYWRRLFKQAQAGGELRTDVDLSAMMMLILGALNSSPDWYCSGEDLSPAKLGPALGTLFLTGLATEHHPTAIAPAAPEAHLKPRPALSGADGPRRAATRARILQAAAEVLGEQGYGGTRISTVAAVAGLRPGSLYYHFHSRDDLLVGMLGEAWEHADRLVHQAVADLPAHASHLDRVSAAMTAHMLSALGRGSYTSGLLRIFEQFPEEVRRPGLAAQLAFTAYWRQLLTSAQEAGEIHAAVDVPSVTMMLIGTSNWAAEWYQPDGRLDPMTLAAQFTTMIFHGLVRRD
ncbi:TetR family transcriptional regulator [Streptomyces sp. NPDC051572]|uniref:TetR family transcriptional regulator n=1 Tax=Streptomyces sp. NPDC051572 TaxID=3155802 RepID=UPI00344F6FD1